MTRKQKKLEKAVDEKFDGGPLELIQMLDRRAKLAVFAKEFKKLDDQIKGAFKRSSLVGEKALFGRHIIEIKDYNRKAYSVEAIENGVSVMITTATTDDMMEKLK